MHQYTLSCNRMTSKQHFHGNFSWNSSPYSYCWSWAKQTHTYSKTKNIAIFFLFKELHTLYSQNGPCTYVALQSANSQTYKFQFQLTITMTIMNNSSRNFKTRLLQEKLCQFFSICHTNLCCTLNMSMYASKLTDKINFIFTLVLQIWHSVRQWQCHS